MAGVAMSLSDAPALAVKPSKADPLFPLPVTPFEYYYLADDRPAYPMTFPFELRFRGALDRRRFTAALSAAIKRHPLLQATIDESTARPSWVRSADSPWLDWRDSPDPIDHPAGERIDLRSEPGLRTWVRAEGDSTCVLHQFHHAACDGLAALRFIEDWMLLYNCGERGGARDDSVQRVGALEKLDSQLLHARGDFRDGAPAPKGFHAARESWAVARYWAGALWRRPAPLAGVTQRIAPAEHADPPPVLEMHVATLPADRVVALKQAASATGATLNDIMMRDLLATIAEWNAEHGAKSRRKLWLNVPVNLRRRSDRGMPAANRIGYAFIGLKPRQCASDDRAMADIRRQMNRIRQSNAALRFLDGLGFACLSGIVPRMVERPSCFATAVLSHLGRTYGRTALPQDNGKVLCGSAVLERIAAAPPVRPLTRAAVATVEYAGELTIALRCDREHFTSAAGRMLLSRFVERLSRNQIGD